MSTMRSQDEIRNTVVSLGLPEHPYFMRRTARAMDLLDTGKVNFVGDEIFRVHSQFDDKIYHVELNHGTPGCTCPDHQKNPGVLCKHMIAATVYQKQAMEERASLSAFKATQMIIRKRSDGVYGIIDGNHLVQISTVNGKRRCNCKNCRKSRQQADCKYKKAIRNNGGGNGSKIKNECGSLHAKTLQDKFNGQLKQSGNNGNGDVKSPSQPMPLDLSDPFQECESYDIDQIEGRKDGELYWKLSNGKYCISYAGVMKLAEKHKISFSVSLHDETNTVIAKAMNGNSRVSGKPMNGCADTAIELAKRNAARQLLPLAEIKAVEHKAKLESEFDWQKAHAKCVELVGIEASVDMIIHELTQAGKLRQDTPSHYNRTEWLIIHNVCKEDADDNSCEERSNHGDPSERTPSWSTTEGRRPELPNNADDFVSECKEAIAKVRDEKKSIEANDQPLQKDNGDTRKLMMDKKLRTWLIESDGTKNKISCREICEQFESKQNPSIVTRLRAGIDDGADISTVELD